MIDCTDRSEDVLARYKAHKASHWLGDDEDWIAERGDVYQLLDDLAVTVESLSHSLAAYVDASLGRAYLAENKDEMREHAKRQRACAMRYATDETGARLFPDPKE